MSKELEAFGLVKRTCELYIQSKTYLIGSDIIENQINEALDTIKNRLEATEKGKNTDIIDNYMAFKNDNVESSEALNCLERLHDCGIFNYEEMEDYNAIKQYILKAQKSPKALEIIKGKCVDIFRIKYYITSNKINELEEYKRDRNLTDEEFNAIKQALLKAQEPKQYLKWEDLEKFEEQKDFFALLNGNKYTLCRYRDSRNKYVMVNLNEINIATLCDMFKQDIDFFNDLHLEVVEE